MNTQENTETSNQTSVKTSQKTKQKSKQKLNKPYKVENDLILELFAKYASDSDTLVSLCKEYKLTRCLFYEKKTKYNEFYKVNLDKYNKLSKKHLRNFKHFVAYITRLQKINNKVLNETHIRLVNNIFNSLYSHELLEYKIKDKVSSENNLESSQEIVASADSQEIVSSSESSVTSETQEIESSNLDNKDFDKIEIHSGLEINQDFVASSDSSVTSETLEYSKDTSESSVTSQEIVSNS